jgi:hypothetical protein
MDDMTGAVVITAILAGSTLITCIVIIGTRAWQRVVSIQSQAQHGNEHLVIEVQGLRKEVAQLRDTTTRYDLAFDTALQRMESRVENLEGKSLAQQQTENERVLSAKVGN